MSTAPIKKMYLILREDLAYKYIQGGHALAQFALEHGEALKDWNNEYLICLSVFNGLNLKSVEEKLRDALLEQMLENSRTDYESYKSETSIKYSVFREPDLQSELPTAIALYDNGIDGNNLLVKNLSLASR